MRKLALSLGAAAMVFTSAAAVPSLATAQSYERRVEHRHARAYSYRRRCAAHRRSNGNKGTVAGSLIGGGSGALIAGTLAGGLIGAGVGAVAGHYIAKHRTRC